MKTLPSRIRGRKFISYKMQTDHKAVFMQTVKKLHIKVKRIARIIDIICKKKSKIYWLIGVNIYQCPIDCLAGICFCPNNIGG